jgi:phage/plasmid-like protein (TIGR03299 family)
MPSAIETNGTQATFVSARELPWHRLGVTLEQDGMTAEEALRVAHLDNWDVRKSPLTTLVDGQLVEVPNQFAVVRNNPFDKSQIDALGVVGKVWTPTQNEEHAEFLNTLTDTSGATIVTAGSHSDGRNVFVTMKMPNTILVGGVDPVDTYIAAMNSHDGTSSFKVITTPVRVVCANTEAAALRGAERIAKVRHTAGKGGAVARVRESLNITFRYMEEFENEVERMVQESLTKGQFDKIVADLYPMVDSASDLVTERTNAHRANVRSLFDSSKTLTGIKGTRWAGYNAITEYVDYFVNVPGAAGEVAATKRAEYNLSGKSDALKEKAFQLFSV